MPVRVWLLEAVWGASLLGQVGAAAKRLLGRHERRKDEVLEHGGGDQRLSQRIRWHVVRGTASKVDVRCVAGHGRRAERSEQPAQPRLLLVAGRGILAKVLTQVLPCGDFRVLRLLLCGELLVFRTAQVIVLPALVVPVPESCGGFALVALAS